MHGAFFVSLKVKAEKIEYLLVNKLRRGENYMKKYGEAIVKHRKLILIISFLLLIPSIIGMANTRINYDMLNYLPSNMDTMKGQDILLKDFDKGAFSILVVDGMSPSELEKLQNKLEKIKHVNSVIGYDSVLDSTIPEKILPDEIYNELNNGKSTLLAIFFDTSTSADETLNAIKEVKLVAGKQCFVTGMSALVSDLKDLCEKEEPIYVSIAVLLAIAAMMLLLDSWSIPIIFIISIGIAIIINMGTNYFMGEISYITKALAAVLQLGVTMDYSIFLWHSYEEEKVLANFNKKEAMANAIANTILAVAGSSITTIAGFIALCFMTFTLGADIGIVMAKGVILGVISCITILPALLLVLDKVIEKTEHKSIIPNMDKFATFLTKKSWLFLIAFVVILVPAVYGYVNTPTYYDMGSALPKGIDYVTAKEKLQNEFDMSTTHMILVNQNMSALDAQHMLAEIDNVDGIKGAFGVNSLLGLNVPEEILPSSTLGMMKNNGHQLIIVNSEYKVASSKVNNQLTELNEIVSKYDKNGTVIGESACTKDMIKITDHDFKVVSAISIIAIFIIIMLVLKSITLPFILVAVIEFAIFINLGIPFYTGTSLPFIAPICLSTIQLGATVDYAILMTTRYKRERFGGLEKHDAIRTALSATIPSIIVSAVGFFAATFGVGLYSNLDIISSMCNLMARGALISMLVVIFILPSLFMMCDKLICKTSVGFLPKGKAKLCKEEQR